MKQSARSIERAATSMLDGITVDAVKAFGNEAAAQEWLKAKGAVSFCYAMSAGTLANPDQAYDDLYSDLASDSRRWKKRSR